MELKTHICRQFVEKGRAFTQITLDDDYIVRDNKPDVVRVIYTKGDIRLEDTKTGNQGVWITGKLHFSTLYQSDSDSRRLDEVEGDIPFQEKLVIDNITEDDDVSVDVGIEDLSVGIINSRKLVVRAVLSISAISCGEMVQELSCNVSEGADYEEKAEEIESLCLVEAKKDVLRIQKEMLLPNVRTNIGEIIFYEVDFRNQDISLQENCIHVQMDAQAWVLYKSESTGEYEYFETTVPIAGEIHTEQLMQTDVFWAKITPMEVLIEPREDYDGESRMLGLEVSLGVELQIYREESCKVLLDAYALDKELVLERSTWENNTLLMKNVSKIRFMEQLKIEPNREKILQICGSSGKAVIDRVIRQEKGVLLEGILFVCVFYNTIEDAMPFQSHCSQIPFEQFVEINHFSEDARIWCEAGVEQLQVNLLDNTEYEVKAGVQVEVLATKPQKLSNITSIVEEPLDMDALQKQPGIIGVVRKEGEELWDIAKKYHATAEHIIEIGDKVLVVKQVK